MSCSSIQSDFEKIVNYYSADEEPGPPTLYIEVMEPVMLPPVDKRGMGLNYKFRQESSYKRFNKMVGETRALESILGRVKMPPIYPPDIVVTDPEGKEIERHTFDTPVTSDEIIVKSIEEKKRELLTAHGIIEEGDRCSVESTFEEISDRKSFKHGTIEEVNSYSVGSSLEEIFKEEEEYYEDLPSEKQNNKDLDETESSEVNNKLDANITPAKIIQNIEDGIHSQAFWKSSKRFLKSRLKTSKRLGTEYKELKFLKGKLKSFEKAKLARNAVWKNEMIYLKLQKKEEDVIFPMHKQERTELIKYAKERTVELWEERKATMAEFLGEKDSTNKILTKAIVPIELNCKDLDEKILKIKRKLKQVWRLFGKRKLRAKLSKYEEMRAKYGEMLEDIKTKIEKRGAFTLF